MTMRSLNLSVLILFTVLLIACKNALPSEPFLEATAERGPEGQIFITGTTNLPNGLTIGVEIPSIKWKETYKDRRGRQQVALLYSQDLKVIIQNGRFRSKGFMININPYPPSKHKVSFTAYFNGAWQSKEMLQIVGDGGKKLQGKLFKKHDPDVIDSDLILDYTITLLFPPLSPESAAIDLVKKAVLTVPGLGRSATNIQENITWALQPPGTSPGNGWSAKAEKGKTYLVAFDFIDGKAGHTQAIWSADMGTKKVQYINKYAKIFSWSPKN